MKTFFIILFFTYNLYCISYAQLPVFPKDLTKFEIIDSSVYVITYNLDIVSDTKKPQELTRDIAVLQIGKNRSKYFSNLLYQADSTSTVLSKNGATTVPLFQETVPPIIVYRNYSTGENTVIYRTFLTGPTFEYKEPILHIDWVLLPEKKSLLGYMCQKAIGVFRGRSYDAWFTAEIPVAEGPYKFGGLPGLILQISDSQKHYVFNCVGIEMPKKNTPILFWDWETQKTTRDKLNLLIKRIHMNPASMAESLGIRLRYTDESGNINREKSSIIYPYNPIELE